jgi:MFS family permease
MIAVVRRLQTIVWRRQILAVLAMVFIADLVVGMYSPTFSLFATSLGASLALLGTLSGTMGTTRILSSVPIGIISDSRGRRAVLTTGMILYAVAFTLFTLVTDSRWLLPVTVVYGLGIASTFFIGIAHVGDVVQKPDRGLAIGVYTTVMGLGFTVGSAVGGQLAGRWGYLANYRVAAIGALIGAAVIWWGLGNQPPARDQTRPSPRVSLGAKLGLLREPHLFAASLGYMLIVLMFDAAIVNFFPLYARSLDISQTAIGTMFAVRALASTTVRMPTGLLTLRIPTRYLMISALSLGMVTVFLICCTGSPVLLTLLLMGEGICFGMFLTSGQAFVAEQFEASDRGAAMGIYGTAGSIGSALGPILLGGVAELWDLRAAFWLTGGLVAVGLPVLIYATRRHGDTAR